MRTFKDIRDKLERFMLPDADGNIRVYEYLRYRPDEVERELKELDKRLQYTAIVIGLGEQTNSWLRRVGLALASNILERDLLGWDDVTSTEHIQIMLWACRSTNFSGLWSWLKKYEATLAER